MTHLIITLGWIAIVTLVLGTLVYCAYALAPRIANFVKAFIKWHFHD